MSNWPTGLMVIQGNRLESLKDVLVTWLKRYPLEPLETDKFLVQSNGIAQWLQQAIAQDELEGGCGIAAAIDVALPGRFIWEAYRAAFWELDTQSPFDMKPMTWRLFRLLNSIESLNQGEYDSLVNFMATGKSQAHRRFILAERIAKLYDQYQVYRADWLQAWEAGMDILPKRDEAASSHSKPVPEEQKWQPMLWRHLVQDVQQDPQFSGDARKIVNRSEIHKEFVKTCRANGVLEGLPRRVIVFGISSLPNQTLEVLQAISPFTQVLLFTMNPSEYFWGDLIEGRQLLRQATSRRPARDGRPVKDISLEEAHLYGNPLLASWGKLGRDYLHSLDEKDQPDQYEAFFVDSKVDLFESPGVSTLLEQLQDDIFQLRSVQDCRELGRRIDVNQDDSIRFVETHSRQREIEVLHDLLLNEFESAKQKGDTLEPKEILIMAPDINVYVPHIEAVFGRFSRYGDHADKRYIPFHIADQSARQQHPIVAAFESLLAITRSRFEATDLLSLLDIPALRASYDIEEVDVATLKSWIEHANIRWGLSKEQRQSLGLESASDQNTWFFGLKRMLLGYSVGEGDIWQGVLPYGEIGGLDARILGQMHRLVDDVHSIWQSFLQPKTLVEWGSALQSVLDTFFTAEKDSERRVISRIEEQIELLEAQVVASGVDEELVAIDVVQETFMGQLDEPALSQRFLSGSVNFATLMPMRAIPFKQVYLIGMNDDDYPQVSTPMDFDLMVGDYRPGDRSRREDARYLFLEAVLSARDKLVISWQGRSAKDNSEQPPSVLVGQLRDYLDKCWHHDTLSDDLTQDYPMQPFSQRYFEEQANVFTYQAEWQSAYLEIDAQAEQAQRLPAWLPDAPLNARKLSAFYRSPIDAMYSERLDIRKPSEIEETKVVENFGSDRLEEWQVHDQVLQYAKRQRVSQSQWDEHVEDALQQHIAAGELHDGAFSEIRKERLFPTNVKQLYFGWKRAIAEREPIPDIVRQAELSIHISDGQAITYEDDLDRLYKEKDGQIVQFVLQTSNAYKDSIISEDEGVERALTENKVSVTMTWRNLVNAWVRHLVANVVHHNLVDTQLMTPNGDVRFYGFTSDIALKALQTLVQAWLNAMHEPMCFGINAGKAYFVKSSRVKKPDLERAVEAYIEKDLGGFSNHYARLHIQEPLNEEQIQALEANVKLLCEPIVQSLTKERSA